MSILIVLALSESWKVWRDLASRVLFNIQKKEIRIEVVKTVSLATFGAQVSFGPIFWVLRACELSTMEARGSRRVKNICKMLTA